MAESSALEKFLTCSVCLETFKEPVSLGCNHSFCYNCIQDYWEKNPIRNCPVCRRKSSKDNTEVNFALKELCDSFSEKLEAGPSKRLKTEEKTPEQLQSELQTLSLQRQSYEDLLKTYEQMNEFSKKQAVQAERGIRAEFSRLQSFLQEEEQRALSALREEQLRQTQNMGPELQKVRETLSSLSNSIQELEKHLQTGSSSPQPQSPAPRLQPKAGLLLDQAKVLGNLGFRVWSNMRSIVSYSPVILDPNSAHRNLYLSEDLRGVRFRDTYQKVPENPERFIRYANVLGSEGFSSGVHQWDVEVGDHPDWTIGVTKESVDRRGERAASPDCGVWALFNRSGKYYNGLSDLVPVKGRLQRLRVKLDYDLGEVSFYDADHMTHLYTHSDTFTEKLFPYFSVVGRETSEVRVLPCDPPQGQTSGTEPTVETPTSGSTSVKKLFKD